MIKFENTEVVGWESAIRGMRNPMNSWEKIDSRAKPYSNEEFDNVEAGHGFYHIGADDLTLMKKLKAAGTDHRKFMRMLTVYVDITAPLYWWKEFDTYKVGTVANSCSTMHKIAEKEFIMDDFSCEHMSNDLLDLMQTIVNTLNIRRRDFLKSNEKTFWWDMIQLLPSSYNQRRTVMLNYEVLANIYKSRKNHKLDEWSVSRADSSGNLKSGFGFCDWIRTLPYSELITMENTK